ncbi:MAG: hypothetical protein LQ342_005960 [Letrouitia transgressa]|nr:MAG: hypothetical protein LQ342_005960 [Letrouitia transgressa]
MATIVLGVQWGDHMLPSGLINPSTINLIGPGVVLHVPTFFSELKSLEQRGISNIYARLKVSARCSLNLDLHAVVDRVRDKSQGVGTTGQGIGPSYSSKAERSNITVSDLLDDDSFADKIRAMEKSYIQLYGEQISTYSVEDEISQLKLDIAVHLLCLTILQNAREDLRPFCVDDVEFLQVAQEEGQKILVEGAQSALLDLQFGTYPYCTSTNTTFGGVMAGLSLDRRKIDNVIGVIKAYTTRVGSGPFPTELSDATGTLLQERGREWGVTTKRKRRIGWLDLVLAKHSDHVNHYDILNVTKLDILDCFEEIKVAVAYKYPESEEEIKGYPMSAKLLSQVHVVYKTLKGWNKSTENITSWQELPIEAQNYVLFIGISFS